MPKRAGFVILLALGGLSRAKAVAAQLDFPSKFLGTVDRREAITVLSGTDTLVWLDSSRVERVRRTLARIRETFPQLRDIRHFGDDSWISVSMKVGVGIPNMILAQSDTTNCPYLCEREVLSSGIPLLDRIVAGWGAKITAYGNPFSIGSFYIYPPRPVDAWMAGNTLLRVPEIDYAGPTLRIGDGSRIRLILKPTEDLYVFDRAGGDCPAGCTVHDFYYVRHVLESNSLLLVATRLHDSPEPWPEVSLWDVPSREWFGHYHALKDLVMETQDTLWWRRHHAIQALRYLVSQSHVMYGEQDPDLFRRMQREMFADWHKTLRIPYDLLSDPDPQVRLAALSFMRDLAHRPFPAAGTDHRAWQRWIDSQPKHHRPLQQVPGSPPGA